MFPLDSFRLARTLAATAAGVLTASVAFAATGGPYRAAAALAIVACLLAYAARYDAENVRANRRTARVRRQTLARSEAIAARNVIRLADFAAREHAAIYGETVPS